MKINKKQKKLKKSSLIPKPKSNPVPLILPKDSAKIDSPKKR